MANKARETEAERLRIANLLAGARITSVAFHEAESPRQAASGDPLTMFEIRLRKGGKTLLLEVTNTKGGEPGIRVVEEAD